MSSEQKESDYHKQEFISVVMTVYSKCELSLKDTFELCFRKAKEIRLKHGFSPEIGSAYKQFRHYIKKLNIEIKKSL